MYVAMLSDFGYRDAYVGTMQAVMLGICPEIRWINLCHDVPAQNVLSGSFLLASAAPFLPENSVILAVVDPGVGSSRRAVAVRTERWLLVGPDNGLFSMVFDHDEPLEAVVLDNPRWHLKKVSRTFHGRDIFSPVAAHLSAGVPLDQLGSRIDPASLVRLPEIGPLIKEDAIECRIVHVDHFGNLITNLHKDTMDATGRKPEYVHIGKVKAQFRSTFSDVPEGCEVCYFNSTGYLELGIRSRNASELLEVGQRDRLYVATSSQ